MKKQFTKIIILVIAFVLLGACFPFVFRKEPSKDKTLIKWTNTVHSANGVLDQTEDSIDFTIAKDGEYSFFLSLIPDGFDEDSLMDVKTSDLGFITSSVIEDAEGNVVYSNVSGAVFLDTTIRMEAGNYKLTHYYSSNREDFYELASTYICSTKEANRLADELDFSMLSADGSTKFNYEFSFQKTAGITLSDSLIVIWAILISAVFAVLMFEVLISCGEKHQFDERQIQEQGKAYRIGYISLIVTLGVLVMLNALLFHSSGSFTVYYGIAILVSIIIFVTYCVWNESYFAVNQNSMKTLIFLGVIGLLNLVISISNIYHGLIIVDGRLTFRVLNLLCTLFLLSIIVTTLIRKALNAKLAASEEEEDDE